MSIRDNLKAKSATLTRRKEFEAGGEKLLAIGLMTGPRNRLIEETRKADGSQNIAKMNPRVIAMCIHHLDGTPIWNVNDLTHLQEIDGLDVGITEPMTKAANFVNGWGEDAVNEGKTDSATEDTNSGSSSPDVSEEA